MTTAVWPLAWRNVVRHAQRSLLTIASIGIGLTALLCLWGLNDGWHNTMVRNFQATFIGSLQIHARGFFTQPTLDAYVQNLETVTTVLASAGVMAWTPRLQSFALAAGTETSAGMLLVGVDPRQERTVTRLASKVASGRFLDATDTHMCILGAISARNLKVGIGDTVILLVQGRDGAMAAERFTLVGILAPGTLDANRGLVLAPLATVQEMLDMPGAVTNVVVRVPEARLDRVTADLRRALESSGLEVLRWSDIFPVMLEWVWLGSSFFYLFLGVVLVIVIAGVLNTVLVSMLERQREFGLLMALGTRSIEIGAVVAVEALIIGVAGTGLGCLLGVGLVSLYSHIGIDLSFMSAVLVHSHVDTVMYPEINTDHLLVTLLAVLVTTAAAAWYPAWRATRLRPAEAMRHI